MNRVNKIIDLLDRGLQKLLIGLMALLLIDVTWQVMTRFILPQPSSFTEELARFLLIWIGLLGSAHAYRHKMHLGVSIVADKLSGEGKLMMNRLVQLIVIGFAASVLVYGGSKLMTLAFDLNQVSASMHVNIGWVYLALPLSGLLLCIFAFEQCFNQDPEPHSLVSVDPATEGGEQ